MAGHVYLIGSKVFGWYKIGKSGNAAIRVSELGVLLPFKIEIVAVWKSSNHHELEKFLHEKYSPYKINGEWFHFRKDKMAVENVILFVNSLRIVTGQVGGLSAFSNIDKDVSAHSKNAEKRIDKIMGRASAAERRVLELEALLATVELPKV